MSYRQGGTKAAELSFKHRPRCRWTGGQNWRNFVGKKKLNQNWKMGCTFVESDTQFAVYSRVQEGQFLYEGNLHENYVEHAQKFSYRIWDTRVRKGERRLVQISLLKTRQMDQCVRYRDGIYSYRQKMLHYCILYARWWIYRKFQKKLGASAIVQEA